MDDKEFEDKMEDLAIHIKSLKGALCKEYALSNAKAKVGYIVKNGDTIILVDNVKWSLPFMCRKPAAVYVGVRLKKDLTPFKSGERDSVVQDDSFSVIKGGQDAK